MVENAPAVLSNVNVDEAVTVVIADRNALTVSSPWHSSFIGYIRESSVAIVSVERIAQRRIGIVEIALTAIDEVNVHPAIIVIIQKGAAGPSSFRQVVLRGFARGVLPGNPAHGSRNLLEGINRIRQSTGKTR